MAAANTVVYQERFSIDLAYPTPPSAVPEGMVEREFVAYLLGAMQNLIRKNGQLLEELAELTSRAPRRPAKRAPARARI